MRRGLLRGLGGSGDPDPRRPVGKSNNLFIDDDLFNLLQPLLVKRQNGVAHQLLLLQFADHVAIVARRQVPLLRDLLRDGLHFGLKFTEHLVCHGSDLGGRNVDAVVFQIERIFLGRKAEIGARLGQHIGLCPRVIFGELRFELVVGFLPARQFVFLEQRGDAFHVAGIAAQFGFNLGAGGINHVRLGHLLHHALLQDVSQRFVSRLHPGIFSDADHGRGPPFRGSLFIEQHS